MNETTLDTAAQIVVSLPTVAHKGIVDYSYSLPRALINSAVNEIYLLVRAIAKLHYNPSPPESPGLGN